MIWFGLFSCRAVFELPPPSPLLLQSVKQAMSQQVKTVDLSKKGFKKNRYMCISRPFAPQSDFLVIGRNTKSRLRLKRRKKMWQHQHASYASYLLLSFIVIFFSLSLSNMLPRSIKSIAAFGRGEQAETGVRMRMCSTNEFFAKWRLSGDGTTWQA